MSRQASVWHLAPGPSSAAGRPTLGSLLLLSTKRGSLLQGRPERRPSPSASHCSQLPRLGLKNTRVCGGLRRGWRKRQATDERRPMYGPCVIYGGQVLTLA